MPRTAAKVWLVFINPNGAAYEELLTFTSKACLAVMRPCLSLPAILSMLLPSRMLPLS